MVASGSRDAGPPFFFPRNSQFALFRRGPLPPPPPSRRTEPFLRLVSASFLTPGKSVSTMPGPFSFLLRTKTVDWGDGSPPFCTFFSFFLEAFRQASISFFFPPPSPRGRGGVLEHLPSFLPQDRAKGIHLSFLSSRFGHWDLPFFSLGRCTQGN